MPSDSVTRSAGSRGSRPTKTVYQLPVQRKLATAPATSGSVRAAAAQSASVTARKVVARNASGAYWRTCSIVSGSVPRLAGSGLRTASSHGAGSSNATWASASAPTFPARPFPIR